MKLDEQKKIFTGLLDRIRFFNSPQEFAELGKLANVSLKLIAVAEAAKDLSRDVYDEQLIHALKALEADT